MRPGYSATQGRVRGWTVCHFFAQRRQLSESAPQHRRVAYLLVQLQICRWCLIWNAPLRSVAQFLRIWSPRLPKHSLGRVEHLDGPRVISSSVLLQRLLHLFEASNSLVQTVLETVKFLFALQ